VIPLSNANATQHTARNSGQNKFIIWQTPRWHQKTDSKKGEGEAREHAVNIQGVIGTEGEEKQHETQQVQVKYKIATLRRPI
jgi:cytochrome c peroxidase